MSEIKGFITFFVNITEDIKIGVVEYLDMIKHQNQVVIDIMHKEGYVSVFVPCYGEACRVEKRSFIGLDKTIKGNAILESEDEEKEKK